MVELTDTGERYLSSAMFGEAEGARKRENRRLALVVVLTDTGERYLSSAMFGEA